MASRFGVGISRAPYTPTSEYPWSSVKMITIFGGRSARSAAANSDLTVSRQDTPSRMMARSGYRTQRWHHRENFCRNLLRGVEVVFMD